MVTMSDVARVAGVSATTVSHVINKTRRIEPETERAVLAAIESTGYLNDRVARSLRTGKTMTIGLAISAISNPYFADVVHAIERAVSANGHSLLLADTHDDPEHERRAVIDLLAHRPDGMLIAPSSDPHDALARIASRGIPTVLIDRVHADTGDWVVDAVGVENAQPMAQLVAHVVERGHRRIGFIAGKEGLQTARERVDGFREGLRQHGLDSQADNVRHGADDAAAAIDDLLDRDEPPTVILMGNNQITIDSMRRLSERGIRVPDDLSIACFDDFPWADLFHPRLTAIRQPVDLLGTTGVELLFDRMRNPGVEARQVRLTPEMVIRDSVRALA
ncbi:LacI family DNA-binding transcriptional regulator [Microcella sp.]|uniref:LacI family DNA-binding transcriptional regulator n=1 Tax=Microcella sp. TaxID=1913979 RepID=UPI003918C919